MSTFLLHKKQDKLQSEQEDLQRVLHGVPEVEEIDVPEGIEDSKSIDDHGFGELAGQFAEDIDGGGDGGDLDDRADYNPDHNGASARDEYGLVNMVQNLAFDEDGDGGEEANDDLNDENHLFPPHHEDLIGLCRDVCDTSKSQEFQFMSIYQCVAIILMWANTLQLPYSG
jgi:hypothetical protein